MLMYTDIQYIYAFCFKPPPNPNPQHTRARALKTMPCYRYYSHYLGIDIYDI